MALYRKRAIVWGILQFLVVFYLGSLVNNGQFRVESDLLKLVPEIGKDAQEQQALTHFSQKLSRKMVFFVDQKNSVKTFSDSLLSSNCFERVKYKIDFAEESKKLNSYYKQLSLVQLKNYVDEANELDLIKLGRENLRKIYSPQSALYSSLLKTDPLLLFSRQLKEFERLSRGKIKQDEDGYLYILDDVQIRYLVLAESRLSSFSSVGQEKLRMAITQAREKAQENSQEKIIVDELGALPFAEVAQKTGKRDAQNISACSLIGLAILIFFYFRRGVYFIATVSSLFFGVTSAVLISHLIYGELHLFTLAFGASLIGVTVDYSFHYFAFYQESKRWTHDLAMQKIGSALLMGFITSVLAYGALLIPNFPGIRSIALFSVVGLSASFASIYLLYPLLFSRLKGSLESTQRRVPKIDFSRIQSSKRLVFLFLITVCSVAAAYFTSQKNNDVKSFSFVPKPLEAKDKQLRALLSDIDSSAFVFVRANSEDDLLAKLRSTKEALKKDNPELMTRDVSDVAISGADWEESKTLLKGVSDKEFKTYEDSLGLKPEFLKSYISSLSQEPIFGVEGLKEAGVFSEYTDMALEKNGQFFGVILFQGENDYEAISSVVDTLPQASFVYRAAEASRIMDRFYANALQMTVLAYLLIAVIIAFWSSVKDSFLIVFIPVAAVGVAWFLISLCGMSTNIFTVFASILLLGVGIDYSIFYNRVSSREEHVKRAVFFSGMTSMLAFGLLSFSSFPALRSFGIVMLIGLIVVYFLAPLAQGQED